MTTANAHIDELRILMTSPTPLPRFAELYEHHYEAVFRAALRVTGNPADAEDALQRSSCVSWHRLETPKMLRYRPDRSNGCAEESPLSSLEVQTVPR